MGEVVMAGSVKCQPGCTCGLHTKKTPKCEPGCTCGRHRKRNYSEETRRRMREAQLKVWDDPEYRERMSEIARDRQRRLWASPDYREEMQPKLKAVTDSLKVESYVSEGYLLVRDEGHPLADRKGFVREHRKVLYDLLGKGPHECHWNHLSQCGNTELEWEGGYLGIYVDHLDWDTSNNDPKNLVVSCVGCNLHRHNKEGAASWSLRSPG